MHESVGEGGVGLGQRVKRQGGIEVVFGVEGHVPHQPAQRRQGEGGAGVGQAVGAEGAAAVLCQQHKTQQGLADQQRKQPEARQKAVAAWKRQQQQGAIDGELPTQRRSYPIRRLRRDVGVGAEITPQTAPVPPQLAQPPGQPAQLQQIGAEAGGRGILQLRIQARLVGVAMVPLVIAAVEIGVVEAQHAKPPGQGVVALAIGEGGAVGALMHGAEAEGQTPAEQRQTHQAQGQRQRWRSPEEAACQQEGAMAEQLAPGGTGAALVEVGEQGRRQEGRRVCCRVSGGGSGRGGTFRARDDRGASGACWAGGCNGHGGGGAGGGGGGGAWRDVGTLSQRASCRAPYQTRRSA